MSRNALQAGSHVEGVDGCPMLRSKASRAETIGPARGRAETGRPAHEPQNHRTVDRVTQILEEVVYKPGMTFAELARALGAPKSSVYGFIQGLLAKGWLYQEDHRFYLGPAVYGLTLASGHIRAGMVTHADLFALHEATGAATLLASRVAVRTAAPAGSSDALPVVAMRGSQQKPGAHGHSRPSAWSDWAGLTSPRGRPLQCQSKGPSRCRLSPCVSWWSQPGSNR
jgi:hypothetical protein